MTREDRLSLVKAFEEFLVPLEHIEAAFDFDGEQARKRGHTLLAADLHRFSASVSELRKRAAWALSEMRTAWRDDLWQWQPVFNRASLRTP